MQGGLQLQPHLRQELDKWRGAVAPLSISEHPPQHEHHRALPDLMILCHKSCALSSQTDSISTQHILTFLSFFKF